MAMPAAAKIDDLSRVVVFTSFLPVELEQSRLAARYETEKEASRSTLPANHKTRT